MLFGFTITNIIANITLKITTPLKGKKEKTTKESALLHHMLLMVHNPSLDDFEALAKDSYLISLEVYISRAFTYLSATYVFYAITSAVVA